MVKLDMSLVAGCGRGYLAACEVWQVKILFVKFQSKKERSKPEQFQEV